MSLLILSLASFLLSLLAVALIKQRFGQQLLDIPNDRSSHTQPTPRGGGLGFIIAFALTSAIAPCPPLSLWLVLLPLTIIGILDDRQGVPCRPALPGAASRRQYCCCCLRNSFPLPGSSFGIAGQIRRDRSHSNWDHRLY